MSLLLRCWVWSTACKDGKMKREEEENGERNSKGDVSS